MNITVIAHVTQRIARRSQEPLRSLQRSGDRCLSARAKNRQQNQYAYAGEQTDHQATTPLPRPGRSLRGALTIPHIAPLTTSECSVLPLASGAS